MGSGLLRVILRELHSGERGYEKVYSMYTENFVYHTNNAFIKSSLKQSSIFPDRNILNSKISFISLKADIKEHINLSHFLVLKKF